MRNIYLALGVVLFAAASDLNAAWKFSGVWKGYGFRAFEYPRDQVRLLWDDGESGFTAYYNPRPNPQPRCPCTVYDTDDGRRFIIEHNRGPIGGWYRGTHFKIVGAPKEFGPVASYVEDGSSQDTDPVDFADGPQ